MRDGECIYATHAKQMTAEAMQSAQIAVRFQGERMKVHLQVQSIKAHPICKTATGFLRLSAHGLIRAYQLTLSSLLGRHCRHLPTCSEFTDEAIARHGVWAGGWMGLSRVCRCHPWGTAGFDPVPAVLPEGTHWSRPWRYGRWRGPLICVPCEEARPSKENL